MSIDELLRDAMARRGVRRPRGHRRALVRRRGTIGRRCAEARHHRRLAVVAVGVAAAVLVGVIVVGLSNRSTPSTTDNLFVGEPTTTV